MYSPPQTILYNLNSGLRRYGGKYGQFGSRGFEVVRKITDENNKYLFKRKAFIFTLNSITLI